jgi:hypothetical protein
MERNWTAGSTRSCVVNNRPSGNVKRTIFFLRELRREERLRIKRS